MTQSRSARLAIALIAAAAVALAACGDDSNGGSAAKGTRTVDIEMHDNAFAPDHVRVAPGETVRFVFHNAGTVAHDAFIGDEEAQDDHEREMRGSGATDMGGMEHHGTAGSGGVTVEPDKTMSITHTFHGRDGILIGCHQPGHYAGGMKLMINVA